jgi:hypothetical protein
MGDGAIDRAAPNASAKFKLGGYMTCVAKLCGMHRSTSRTAATVHKLNREKSLFSTELAGPAGSDPLREQRKGDGKRNTYDEMDGNLRK